MSSKVTYGDIIEALSRKTGFSKQKSEAFAKALMNRVQQELEETGKSSITNFGSFKVKEVAERQGQNPQTGEPITIPAHKRVSFTPYKALRERVNAKYAHLESEVIEEGEESSTEEIAEAAAETTSKETVAESTDDTVKSTRKTAYADRRKGNNTGLIIFAILMLVVIASVSLWYLFSGSNTQLATDEAVIEQPQTPEAAAQLMEEDIQLEAESAEQNMSAASSAESETVFEEESELNGNDVKDIKQAEASSQSPEMNSDLIDYTVSQDEWYWVIARKVYGKERFWPIIFMYNSSHGVHPDSLDEGVKLEIPPLEGSAENPTSRDLRRLAEASELVANAYRQHGRTDKANEYDRFAKKWASRAQ